MNKVAIDRLRELGEGTTIEFKRGGQVRGMTRLKATALF